MKIKLVKKVKEATDTYSFFFEPDQKFEWKAGQYMYLTIPNLKYSDERGDTRHFTISSSPTEGNLIRITTRIRAGSGFKKALNELEIGDQINSEGPNGLFIFDENVANKHKNNIFFAGGIGITPFRSIIKYNIDKNYKAPMYLVYSNSNSEFVFMEDLYNWEKSADYLKTKYIDTSKEGRLDEEKLSSILKEVDIKNTTFWVVGPPPFTSAMEELLTKLAVPSDYVETEKFTGY